MFCEPVSVVCLSYFAFASPCSTCCTSRNIWGLGVIFCPRIHLRTRSSKITDSSGSPESYIGIYIVYLPVVFSPGVLWNWWSMEFTSSFFACFGCWTFQGDNRFNDGVNLTFFGNWSIHDTFGFYLEICGEETLLYTMLKIGRSKLDNTRRFVIVLVELVVSFNS